MTTWRGGFRGGHFVFGVTHGIDTASETRRFAQPFQELPHEVRASGAPGRHALGVDTTAAMDGRVLAGSGLPAAQRVETRTADPRLRRTSAVSRGRIG